MFEGLRTPLRMPGIHTCAWEPRNQAHISVRPWDILQDLKSWVCGMNVRLSHLDSPHAGWQDSYRTVWERRSRLTRYPPRLTVVSPMSGGIPVHGQLAS